MAELVARIDGLISLLSRRSPEMLKAGFSSTVICSLGISKRRVHAVRIPMDELLIDERDQCTEYDPHVGHVFGACLIIEAYIFSNY